MTAYEYIKNYVNTKLQPSPINGVGVFALRDIQKGEEVFKLWDGKSGEYTISTEELNSFENDIRMHLLNMYGYKKIEDEYKMFVILNKDCHWIFKTPIHWVNSCGHNDTPNVDNNTLKAIRTIKKGEEILFKYGKYDKFKKNNVI